VGTAADLHCMHSFIQSPLSSLLFPLPLLLFILPFSRHHGSENRKEPESSGPVPYVLPSICLLSPQITFLQCSDPLFFFSPLGKEQHKKEIKKVLKASLYSTLQCLSPSSSSPLTPHTHTHTLSLSHFDRPTEQARSQKSS